MSFRSSSYGRERRSHFRARGGRGFRRTTAEIPDIPEPPLGPITAVINRGELDESSDAAHEAPCITDCTTVASYNWLNRAKPTILIPGSPPAWTPLPRPPKLSEDSGQYFRDQNAGRYPSYPLQPAMEAVVKQNPAFDFASVDIVACGSTMGNLLRFVRGLDKRFRTIVEVVGTTVFLLRREKSPTETIPNIRGYGHTFPEAYTTWDRDVKGSESHQRVIQYKFGKFQCLVRFEADGYLPDLCDAKKSTNDTSNDSAISSLLGQATVSPHVPEGSESFIVQDGGQPVPQAALFDLKTRSFRRKEDDILAEELPRHWVAQIPNFVLAFHTYGIFDDIRIQDVRSAVREWEEKESKALRRFEALLGQLLDFAQGQADGRFEIVHEESADVLELREVMSEANHVLPDGLKARLLTYDGDHPDDDRDNDYLDDDHHSDSDISWVSESEKDFTACSASSCGYCGHCKY